MSIEKTSIGTVIVACLIGIPIVILVMLLATPAMLLQAWVMTVLWGWFVVPFISLPVMTMKTALGMVVLSGLLRFQVYCKDEREPTEKVITGLCHMFVAPLVTLFIGWVVYTWMR